MSEMRHSEIRWAIIIRYGNRKLFAHKLGNTKKDAIERREISTGETWGELKKWGERTVKVRVTEILEEEK